MLYSGYGGECIHLWEVHSEIFKNDKGILSATYPQTVQEKFFILQFQFWKFDIV